MWFIKWSSGTDTQIEQVWVCVCVHGCKRERERDPGNLSLYSKSAQAILSLECLVSSSARVTWAWPEWAWAAARWRWAGSWAAGWDPGCWWDPWWGRRSWTFAACAVWLRDGRARRAVPGRGPGYTTPSILHTRKELNTTNKDKQRAQHRRSSKKTNNCFVWCLYLLHVNICQEANKPCLYASLILAIQDGRHQNTPENLVESLFTRWPFIVIFLYII